MKTEDWISVKNRLPGENDYPVLYHLPELQGGPVIYPKLSGIRIPNNNGGFWQSILMPDAEVSGEPKGPHGGK